MSKVQSLATLAKDIALTHPSLAYELAKAIKDENKRDNHLLYLSQQLDQSHCEIAFQCAQSITTKEMKTDALANLAGKIVLTNFKIAFQAVKAIENEEYRNNRLANLSQTLTAQALNETDPIKRNSQLEQALESALAMTKPLRDDALSVLSQKIFLINFDIAFRSTNEIEDKDKKNKQLYSLSQKFAKDDPKNAFTCAKSIDDSTKNNALAVLAQNTFLTNFDIAQKALILIDKDDSRNNSLYYLATELIKIGKNKEALELAKDISQSYKDNMLINLARAIPKNDPEKFAFIHKISLDELRNKELHSLVTDPDTDQETASKALNLITKASPLYKKALQKFEDRFPSAK